MQARRASRELAFILFSQFEKTISDYSKENLDDMIVKSIRILLSSATDDLKISLGALIDMKNKIDDYEAEHEINLNRPLGAQNIPVPMVLTSDMAGRINEMIDVAEFTALDSEESVKEYALSIISNYRENSKEIDEIIKNNSTGWDFERLVKTDKDILRIALSELLYVKQTPM